MKRNPTERTALVHLVLAVALATLPLRPAHADGAAIAVPPAAFSDLASPTQLRYGALGYRAGIDGCGGAPCFAPTETAQGGSPPPAEPASEAVSTASFWLVLGLIVVVVAVAAGGGGSGGGGY